MLRKTSKKEKKKEKNNFTICMETQKTLKSQSDLQKEKTKLEESGSLTLDYITKLQE